jgi:DNA invertase Pin-like site-specific DNA recombinase
MKQLIETVETLRLRGIGFRSLTEALDTTTGRLMLAVLGGLADVERDLIRTRTAEGRSRAKAQGQHMGRPPTLSARCRRKRPHSGAQRALRCKNWRTATMWAYQRFVERRAINNLGPYAG